jgi:L-ascorbate metabolism protein UlaG (beta-lactamase superfamily)
MYHDLTPYKHLFVPENAVAFRQNERLTTVFEAKPQLQQYAHWWKGTPLDAKGLYMNLGEQMKHDFGKFIQWQLGGKPQKQEKKADTWRHEIQKNSSFLATDEDGILWLGHASYFMRFRGTTLLIDPVFGGMPFVTRLSELPIKPEKLPAIDYLLLSHNHRDHADAPSLRKLLRSPKNRKTVILTGLSMEKLVKPWTCGQTIQSAGWWQQFDITDSNITITFTPSQHWARRGLTDMNEMLWGGFMIETIDNKAQHNTTYFAGDSGLGPHFKLIGAVFPTIETAIIGCGAYKPAFIMQSNHTSPDEAVQAAIYCGASTLLPMHYGTFDLSDEPLGEPFRRLTELQSTTTGLTINLLPIGQVY